MRNKYASRLAEYIPYLALALLIGVVVMKANPYTTILSRDMGSFLYTGRLILRGQLPYINAWDNKPPGIFYLNALGLWLGRGTSWGLWLLQFLFLYATAVIGYRLLLKVWRPGTAVVGIILWIWGLDVLFSKGDVVEEYSLLFNMAILFFYWMGNRNQKARIYDLLIGVMTVLSFLFRANNIGPSVAVGICWIIIGIVQKKYRLTFLRLATMLAGVAVTLLFVALFLWRQGILEAAWNASIIYNFSYIHDKLDIKSAIFAGFGFLGLVAWIALLGYGASVFFIIRGLKTKSVDPFILLLVVLWPVEIYLSSLSGRSFFHYFINWLPVIALLCGYAYDVFSSAIFTPKVMSFLNTEKIPMIAAVLVSIFIHFNRVVNFTNSLNVLLFNRAQGVELITPVAQYIRRNTKPSDTVIDWVQSGINYMAQRDSPTPYLWYPEYLPSPVTSALENGFYKDITLNPPEIIVDAYLVAPDNILSLNKDTRNAQLNAGKGVRTGKADNIDLVFQFIQKHYKVETVIDGDTIYRLIKPYKP